MIVHYYSSAKEADALIESLKSLGVKAEAFQCDLSKADKCKTLFEKAVTALGPIDLLINNASVFQSDNAEVFDNEKSDLHFAIHVKAPWILSAEMASQTALKDGLIVNMIDQRVKRLSPNYYSYTLSKSALWTATQTLAQSFAPKIRVNAIAPGPTLPNERQSQVDFDKQIDGLILKRGPELEAFGATVRYMWNMRSFTGQMIALDGGQHLAWETPDIAGINE